MASWFNVDALKGLAEQATEKVSNAANATASAIPKLDGDIVQAVQKLTLTTPELRAEHDRIDQEERRKEEVRDMLAGMLPWETRDRERDILVEECKEAVLKLSSREDVFLGPYEMPSVNVKLDDDPDSKSGGSGNDDDNDEGDNEENNQVLGDDDDGTGDINTTTSEQKPSEESLERLQTLEPLPALLQEFDLDSHVGLINRLLKEDPQLVEMQSKLSGGGEREVVFWRNYFFNCAWCRYEAGLSIDEWYNPVPIEAEDGSGGPNNKGEGAADDHEEEIHFESEHEETSIEDKAFPSDPTTDADAPFKSSSELETAAAMATTTSDTHSTTTSPPATAAGAAAVPVESRSDAASSAADFEMVGGNTEDDDDLAAGDPVDDELDELEAEIARELED